MNLVLVEQPGRVGILAEALDQLLGEAQHELRGRVLAGMDRGSHEEPRLRAGEVLVGEHEHAQIVAAERCSLLPGVADVAPRGQRRVRQDHRRRRRVGLCHRPVAGEARNAGERRLAARRPLRRVTLRLLGVTDPPRPLRVDLDVEAEVAQGGHALRAGLDRQKAELAIDAVVVAPRRDRTQHRRVAEPSAHHPGTGTHEVVDAERPRWRGRSEQGEQESEREAEAEAHGTAGIVTSASRRSQRVDRWHLVGSGASRSSLRRR